MNTHLKNSLIVLFLLGANHSAWSNVTRFERSFDDPNSSVSSAFGIGNFGSSADIHNGLVIIGDPGESSRVTSGGRAYLFDTTSGALLRSFDDPRLSAPFVSNNYAFGADVALSDDLAIVSGIGRGGAVSGFSPATGELTVQYRSPSPSTSHRFGSAISVYGRTVVVGDNGFDDAIDNVGQAHLYDALSGVLQTTLNDPTPTAEGRFGDAVAIDNGLIAVGAPLAIPEGSSVSAGEVHVFNNSGELIHSIPNPEPDLTGLNGGSLFGSSVAIYNGLLLIGARGKDIGGQIDVGRAYLYNAVTGVLIHSFAPPNYLAPPMFGSSVALDGSNLLIGAPFDRLEGISVGRTYLFDTSTGLLVDTIRNPAPSNKSLHDFFGSSLAIDRDFVIVGAPSQISMGEDRPRADLFRLVPEPHSLLLFLLGFIQCFSRPYRGGNTCSHFEQGN